MIITILFGICSSLVLLSIFCIIRANFVEEDKKIYGFKIVITQFADDHREYDIYLKKSHDIFFFHKYWFYRSTYDSYERAKERLLEIKREYEEELVRTTVTKKIEIL